MRPLTLFFLLSVLIRCVPATLASIFLSSSTRPFSLVRCSPHEKFHRRRTLHRHSSLAMAIPGNGVAEQVVIGGFGNFITIYNYIVTGRILLSWFPQAQGVGALQPVYQITDPYLNIFRGIIPPVFGVDFSPVLAFVTLNLLQSTAVTLAMEVPEEMKEKILTSKWGMAFQSGRRRLLNNS